MTGTGEAIEVPNLPTVFSHAPAGWAGLIRDAIEMLDREYPDNWELVQIKQKFGGLRISYTPPAGDADQRKAVWSAIREIEARSYQVCDICGTTANVVTAGESRRTRCPRHRHADDIDLQIAPRPAQRLTAGMGGVWIVETHGSLHIWDLDEMTYTRRPGPSSGSGSMRFDGNAMPITRVEAWPSIGERSVVWFDDPEDPEQTEHHRISARVTAIRPASGDAHGERCPATSHRAGRDES